MERYIIRGVDMNCLKSLAANRKQEVTINNNALTTL